MNENMFQMKYASKWYIVWNSYHYQSYMWSLRSQVLRTYLLGMVLHRNSLPLAMSKIIWHLFLDTINSGIDYQQHIKVLDIKTDNVEFWAMILPKLPLFVNLEGLWLDFVSKYYSIIDYVYIGIYCILTKLGPSIYYSPTFDRLGILLWRFWTTCHTTSLPCILQKIKCFMDY